MTQLTAHMRKYEVSDWRVYLYIGCKECGVHVCACRHAACDGQNKACCTLQSGSTRCILAPKIIFVARHGTAEMLQIV